MLATTPLPSAVKLFRIMREDLDGCLRVVTTVSGDNPNTAFNEAVDIKERLNRINRVSGRTYHIKPVYS